jgi:hypothetical protein
MGIVLAWYTPRLTGHETPVFLYGFHQMRFAYRYSRPGAGPLWVIASLAARAGELSLGVYQAFWFVTRSGKTSSSIAPHGYLVFRCWRLSRLFGTSEAVSRERKWQPSGSASMLFYLRP